MNTANRSVREHEWNGDGSTGARLERARLVARALDASIRVPGTGIRIGLDPVFGLVPVLGDSVAALASLYVVYVGVRAGVPAHRIAGMIGLVALDLVVGSVPLVGPLFDAVLKVNERNVATIESYATGAA